MLSLNLRIAGSRRFFPMIALLGSIVPTTSSRSHFQSITRASLRAEGSHEVPDQRPGALDRGAVFNLKQEIIQNIRAKQLYVGHSLFERNRLSAEIPRSERAIREIPAEHSRKVLTSGARRAKRNITTSLRRATRNTTTSQRRPKRNTTTSLRRAKRNMTTSLSITSNFDLLRRRYLEALRLRRRGRGRKNANTINQNLLQSIG